MIDNWSQVYDFWFGEPGSIYHGEVRDFWFGGGAEFDEEIAGRFSETYADAVAGRLDGWFADPRGAVSLIVVLDQFPRNMFCGDPRSFEYDHLALANAKKLVDSPSHRDLMTVEKLFAYLPYEHSENMEDQNTSVSLFVSIDEHEQKQEWLDYAVEHRDIIERFGRFPHRNPILGRVNTPEEEAWLQETDQRFGTVSEDDADK